MIDTIRLHNLVQRTKVLGPGERFAVWLQGCNRNCKGCMSPSSRPLEGGRLASISRLRQLILSQQGLEGITISGGEPFLQPEALCALLEGLEELGVIVYTGFTLEQLQAMQDPWVDRLLQNHIDLLIDGPYIEEQNDGKSLKGSANQRLLFLTERYLPYRQLYEGTNRNAEVYMADNELFFVGIPNKTTWQQWSSAVDTVNTDKK